MDRFNEKFLSNHVKKNGNEKFAKMRISSKIRGSKKFINPSANKTLQRYLHNEDFTGYSKEKDWRAIRYLDNYYY